MIARGLGYYLVRKGVAMMEEVIPLNKGKTLLSLRKKGKVHYLILMNLMTLQREMMKMGG